MKRYHELTEHQKDLAADKALETIINKMVGGLFHYGFKDASTAKFVTHHLRPEVNKEYAIEILLDSDEVAEELWPYAEIMAATALFAEKDEYVINNIV